MFYLRGSTAATILMGPFVSNVDGDTEAFPLLVAADIWLSKNGASTSSKWDSTDPLQDNFGFYRVTLGAYDTDTIGTLKVVTHKTGCLPVWQDCMVLSPYCYDTFIAATQIIDVNVTQIDGQATNGNNATLNLKKLNIVNDAGDAVVVTSSGNNGNGMIVTGNGSGNGILATGGNSITTAGIKAVGASGNADGVFAVGTGAGHGMRCDGGTSGAGVYAISTGTAPGVYAVGGLSGGSTAAGIWASASSNASGIRVTGNGTGDGLNLTAGASGYDMRLASNADSILKLSQSATTMRAGTVDITNFAPTASEFESSEITDPLTGHWTDRSIVFRGGALNGCAKAILNYSLVSGKGHFTTDPFPTAPSDTDPFEVV